MTQKLKTRPNQFIWGDLVTLPKTGVCSEVVEASSHQAPKPILTTTQRNTRVCVLEELVLCELCHFTDQHLKQDDANKVKVLTEHHSPDG